MSTYNIGTVSVSATSTAVTGSGTSWVAIGVREGDYLIVNGLVGIVASVESNTALTLLRGWPGTTASGQQYSIALIDDGQRSIASLNQLLQTLENGVAAGRFGDGNAAQPGVAFVDQTNTGIFRPSASVLALSINGTERARITTSGMHVTGSISSDDKRRGVATLANPTILGSWLSSAASFVSVSISPALPDANYSVFLDLRGASDLARAGNLEVYDKASNGFKIRSTGPASSVQVGWSLERSVA